MRVLKFIVEGQSIKKDPSCDFSGIVPGSKGYLRAEFTFDSDWNGCGKAVVFENVFDKKNRPIINGACEIPEEVLRRKMFYVKVAGKRDGFRIETNKERVIQDG